MAGTFSNRKALKKLAFAVAEKMPYITNAGSIFPQDSIAKKKYGMACHAYLPDAGSVSEGLTCHPDRAHQVEITAYLRNFNTSAEVDMWNELVDIEDLSDEMVDRRAGKLAREAQKAIMSENVYRSAQAVVATSAGLPMLGEAAAKLDELQVDGEKVCFQTPTVYSTIGDSTLKNFLPSERMKEIYEDRALGTYHTVGQVQLPGLEILDTTGMDAAPTISAAVVKDASNNVIGLKPINSATGSGTGSLIKGVPYAVSGLKIVDEGGVETAQDYVVIINEETRYDADGNKEVVTYVPELRVTVSGKAYGNPNAHIDATTLAAAIDDGVATFTLTPLLTASKKYQVGQARTIKGLTFDQYRFGSLPAAQQDNVGTYENITLKMQSAPQLIDGVNCFRIDFPFCAKQWEIRQSVTTYLLLA
jgi:hypothetical protein